MQVQHIEQDQQFIKILRQKILLFQQDTLPKINQSKMNLFFVGKSGGGKSTLLNGISDRKIKFQKDESGCYIPIQDQSEMYFDIAVDQSESKTKDPKPIQLNEDYQIWDLPGYQDSRSAKEDLKNLIIKKLIIDNSNLSHVVIVLQECQLTGDKGMFLIDIINILSEDDIIPTLIVSFANEDLDLEYLYDQLQKYISNDESILTKKGKILLQKVVDYNRVQLFKEPILISYDNYELCKENLNQLKDFILQPQFFNKISMKFLLLDDAKQLLKQLCLNLNQDLQRFENEILSQLLEIQELEITDYNSQNTLKIHQLEMRNQELTNQYTNQLKNIKILGQFIQEFNELEDEALNIKQQVKKIVTLEQIVQQVNILKIFCGQITIQRLKEIIKCYNGIDTIFIYSIFSFQVDQCFDYQGLTICIKTKNFIVASSIKTTINLSGKNGNLITESKAQQNQNSINGNNGLNGNNGQNGGNFVLDAKECVNMDKLIINLSGGNGSDGQEGGDGKNGEKGCDAEQKSVNMKAQNCEQFCEEADYFDDGDIFTFNKENHIHYISKGTSGTQGGNAGRGGLGGQNGLKGLFKIVNSQGSCEIINQDGISGQNGINGKVGQGGINGKDYERKLYDIKFFEGIDKVTNQTNLIKDQRKTLGWWTLGTVQTVGSIVQKLVRNGRWVEQGQFNNNGYAQNGVLNEQFQYQLENRKKNCFEEHLEQFSIFKENIKFENKGTIYDHLLQN